MFYRTLGRGKANAHEDQGDCEVSRLLVSGSSRIDIPDLLFISTALVLLCMCICFGISIFI